MKLVIDASTILTWLLNSGADGDWAQALIRAEDLAAPHLMPIEVANGLRKSVLNGAISAAEGYSAHEELLDLPVELFPYASLAARVWELRQNVTSYDACYVALAEELEVDFATTDLKLSRASGPRCRFRTPPRRRERSS